MTDRRREHEGGCRRRAPLADGQPDLEEIIGNFESVANGPCNGQGGWLKVLR